MAQCPSANAGRLALRRPSQHHAVGEPGPLLRPREASGPGTQLPGSWTVHPLPCAHFYCSLQK